MQRLHELICRATPSGNSVGFSTEIIQNNKVIGKLDIELSKSLDNLILSDKKYGLLKPKNGSYYTYRVLSLDTEITAKQMNKAVASALNRWAFKLKLKFSRANIGEASDITIQFRSEAEDPLLNSSTIAYMYYPLGGLNNGIMVINIRFYYTLSGKAVNMHLIDPIHYPDFDTAPVQGLSHDLDVILYHEFGHGILGLQHDPTPDNGMAYRYDLMSKMPSLRDIARGAAKIGLRVASASMLKRLWDWLTITEDRE